MACSSSSLVFSSLTLPKTLIHNRTPSAISLPSSSLKLNPKQLVFSQLSKAGRFARSVAVTSEFEQDEDVLSDDGAGGGGERNFSPDLKLFVGNLPFNVDSATLAGLFEQAGNVEMVEVIYDKITGRSRGFGFVTMSTLQEVEAAAEQLNGYELEGRPLRVNFGPPPPRDPNAFRSPRGESSYGSGGSGYGGGRGGDSSNRVYVGNLSWGVDDMALESLFSEKGKVTEAKVVYDRETGRSRGFGFVTYASAEEVNSAVDSLDGADLDGRSIRVSVAESKPRRQF